MPRLLLRLLTTAGAAAACVSPAISQCSQFANPTPGMDLQMTDESVAQVALPFGFPFHGTTYSAISICSDGFIWLGQNGTSDYDPQDTTLLADGPRICPLWWDLDPGASGQVTFAADATQASICWKNVQEWNTPGVFANFECILSASGAITFHYGAGNGLPTVQTIVGISRGNGVAPNARVWTSDIATTATIVGATGHQTNAPNVTLPLNAGGWLRLLPSGPNDYAVSGASVPTCPPAAFPPRVLSTISSYGQGCPPALANGSIYEAFTANGGANQLDLANRSILFTAGGGSFTTAAGPGLDPNYSTNGVAVTMGDETLMTLPLGAMSQFPWGQGFVTQIVACSNGYVWLTPDTGIDFSATPGEFTSQAARLAPLWHDFNFASGGAFYWENTNPAFCQATWANVPEWPANGAHTFQLRLFSNGDIAFSYGALAGATSGRTPLVGISGGNGPNPGSFNLVTGAAVNAVTRSVVGRDPMTHTASGGAIGLPLLLSASVPPPVSGFGVFVVGFTQFNPGASLAGLGAPGCEAYESLDFMFFATFVTSPMATAVPVPLTTTIVGLQVFSQAASATTANAFGFYTSNAQAITLGNTIFSQ
jgi:hypothetical protein